MNYKTKLSAFITKIQNYLKNKVVFFEIYFASAIFFLFFGFLLGNLFGSFLNIFRESIIWNGFITLIVLLLEEVISYLIYHSKKRTPFFTLDFINLYFLEKLNFFYKKKFFIRSLNLFKIGVLLGFFIDAFKVGS